MKHAAFLFAALAVVALTTGCHRAAAASGAPVPEAVVQPGAPGQDSTIVKSVPKYHDADEVTPDDVKFMQGMIHHHNQALIMSAMIPTHTTTVQLIELGKKITISQSDEMKMMKEWLAAHHQPVPMIMPDGTAMMGDMDMAPMPGMLTAAEMKQLDAARGTEFDRLFLTGMIKHHQGAITMVADLHAAGGGVQPTVADYVNDVYNDQSAEITRMQGLLGGFSK